VDGSVGGQTGTKHLRNDTLHILTVTHWGTHISANDVLHCTLLVVVAIIPLFRRHGVDLKTRAHDML
jgi:hypothetical protein